MSSLTVPAIVESDVLVLSLHFKCFCSVHTYHASVVGLYPPTCDSISLVGRASDSTKAFLQPSFWVCSGQPSMRVSSLSVHILIVYNFEGFYFQSTQL